MHCYVLLWLLTNKMSSALLCCFCIQEARTNVISRQLEINEVEKSLQQSIKAVEVRLLSTFLAVVTMSWSDCPLTSSTK